MIGFSECPFCSEKLLEGKEYTNHTRYCNKNKNQLTRKPMGFGTKVDEDLYEFAVNWFKLHKFASSNTLSVQFHRLGRNVKASGSQKYKFAKVLRKLNAEDIIVKYNGNNYMRIDEIG